MNAIAFAIILYALGAVNTACLLVIAIHPDRPRYHRLGLSSIFWPAAAVFILCALCLRVRAEARR